MSVRVQVVMSEVDRETFRGAAKREGLALSDWLRRAARDRLRLKKAGQMSTVDDLRTFFAECDKFEEGNEPEWKEHLAVIEESRASQRPLT